MHVNPRGGEAFDDADVAAAYVYRPPYPDELFAFLKELSAHRRRALDLGCGTGKLAHRLAASFEHVDAVDPSASMLAIADDGSHRNVSWIHGYAEEAQLADRYDLVTAGASIHWMDHAVIFPRLASIIEPGGYIAIIEGDGAHNPPWRDAWERHLARWIPRLGGDYDPDSYGAMMTAYRSWLEISGERAFEDRFSQPVDHFIECQHSRATWSRANMGLDLAAEFDAELRDLLSPHAIDGNVSYTTRTSIIWGQPKAHVATRSPNEPGHFS